jgi:hypothetical protein
VESKKFAKEAVQLVEEGFGEDAKPNAKIVRK